MNKLKSLKRDLTKKGDMVITCAGLDCPERHGGKRELDSGEGK